MKMIPLPYLGLMSGAGLAFGWLAHNQPNLQSGYINPLVWLIFVALAYEAGVALAPRFRLQPIQPMQRFGGYFVGALIYLALIKFLA